jgi:AhpC/TSA family
MLRTRQLIPPLTMQTPDGGTVRAWDFKQKKNLVIAFLDAGCGQCEEFLNQLVQRAAQWKEKEAVAVAVFLEPVPIGLGQSLPPEIIVGSDVSGRSFRRFLGEDSISARSRMGRGVFVTDRYGELSALWVSGLREADDHAFPSADEVLASLEHIQIACEECFMPHWPSDP